MHLNIESRALLNDIAHDRAWRSGGLDWQAKAFPGNCGRYPDRAKVGKKLLPLIAAGYAVLRDDDRYEITDTGRAALHAAQAVRFGRVELQVA